jgi:hypothetical protein
MLAQWKAFATKENAKVMLGIVAAAAIVQVIPGAGEVFDGAMVGLFLITAGPAAFEGGQELGRFLLAIIGVATEKDVDDAAEHLAHAVTLLGVAALLTWLQQRAARGAGRAATAAEDSTRANLKASGESKPRLKTPSREEPQPKESAVENSPAPRTNTEIRQWYNEKVGEIPKLNEGWKQQGLSAETRAQMAHQIRHDARLQARSMMQDKGEIAALRARDVEKYGNPDGPSFEDLVRQNREAGLEGDDGYEAIVSSSNRPNAAYNAKFNIQPP